MFEFFRASVVNLRRDWDALSHLFMDAKRRAYLKSHLPNLEDRISTLLTVSVYMGIACLFDSPMTFNDPGKSNLILRRVIDDLAPPKGTPERARIEADHLAMKPTVKLIKDWRNVIGAHWSLPTTIALVDYIKSGHKQPHPLPHIPLMAVRDVLQCLVSTTDAITKQIEGGPSQWYDFGVVREVNTLFAAAGVP